MTATSWFGYPGHFIGAPKCRFHLHTHVGRYCVSSVGDYWPRDAVGAVEIGAGRLYETMVFDLEADEGRWIEIDADGYNDSAQAEMGHRILCDKWAR